MNKRKIKFLYFLYIIYILIPAAFYILGSGLSSNNIIYQLGKIFGITGLTLLVLQMLLSSRFKMLEKGVGHNNLLIFHSLNAKIAVTFLLLHPLFLIWGMNESGVGLTIFIKSFSIFTWLGVVTLLSLIVSIISALYSEKFGLKYEIWRLFHKLVYFIIIAGFIHSYFLGTEIILKTPLFYWWVFLVLFAVLIFTYRNFIRTFLLKNSNYRILKIKNESKNVHTIYLEPINDNIFKYIAGQFAFTSIFNNDLPLEEHHFTISSIPDNPYISFTIKESGDYTAQLGKLKVGDKVRIEGPFGVFNNENIRPPYIFIAGGIGITPLMAMLRSAGVKHDLKNYSLIYSNKTRKDIIFSEELEGMRKEGLILFQVLSQEKIKGYYNGRIDTNLLKKLIKGRKNSAYFIVGPPPMMKDVKNSLMKIGVKKDRIFTERFSLK